MTFPSPGAPLPILLATAIATATLAGAPHPVPPAPTDRAPAPPCAQAVPKGRPPCGFLVRGASETTWFDALAGALTHAGFSVVTRTPGAARQDGGQLVVTMARPDNPYRFTQRYRCWATETGGELDCCPEREEVRTPATPDATLRNQYIVAFEDAMARAMRRLQQSYRQSSDGTRTVLSRNPPPPRSRP